MMERRKFLTALCTASIGFAIAALPCKITASGSTLELASQSAFAKDGNNGKGGGGGNGGGNGRGGNGGGNSSGNASGGSSNSRSSSASTGASAKSTTVRDNGSGLSVRHSDGISEEIRGGRYIMKDSRGRTIVNRRATSADAKRLQAFVD
ncbi:hypothetical protein EHS39_18805 [Ensifer sp. MPMI2T]|nr:hypothetical protein EHS39_18805 [Ensifer sp. MPMI2T]